ncbi:hypothetical protein AB1Y20_022148 [Prymnesium parvum]|uniref:Uncharacterized protein n=1 Tax=Prymnesium parvum TaxID=97485 RepID=A0AB34JH53_PRYPA
MRKRLAPQIWRKMLSLWSNCESRRRLRRATSARISSPTPGATCISAPPSLRSSSVLCSRGGGGSRSSSSAPCPPAASPTPRPRPP